jgi:hypothetical protein
MSKPEPTFEEKRKYVNQKVKAVIAMAKVCKDIATHTQEGTWGEPFWFPGIEVTEMPTSLLDMLIDLNEMYIKIINDECEGENLSKMHDIKFPDFTITE